MAAAVLVPRLLNACGFDVKEVTTLRGDGNNLYQYALMTAGSRLNDLRLRLWPQREADTRTEAQGGDKDATSPPSSRGNERMLSSTPVSRTLPPAAEPSGLLRAWLNLLTRVQPITNALARRTRPLIEPIERRGWGDELLVYARRMY